MSALGRYGAWIQAPYCETSHNVLLGPSQRVVMPFTTYCDAPRNTRRFPYYLNASDRSFTSMLGLMRS